MKNAGEVMRNFAKMILCFFATSLLSITFCFGAEPLPKSLIVSKLKEAGYSNLNFIGKDKDVWLFVATRIQKRLQLSVDPTTGEVRAEQKRETDIIMDPFSSGKQDDFIDSILGGDFDDE